MKVTIDSLGLDYGKHKALDSISFDVKEGEVISVVGPNGSGKSTLIRCIAQIHSPTRGAILIDDRDAARMDPGEVARAIGYVPQNFHFLFF